VRYGHLKLAKHLKRPRMGVSGFGRRMRRTKRSAHRAGEIYGIVRRMLCTIGSVGLVTSTPCPGVLRARLEVELRGDVLGTSRLGLCGVVGRSNGFVCARFPCSDITIHRSESTANLYVVEATDGLCDAQEL
jgi:hypothetical protein